MADTSKPVPKPPPPKQRWFQELPSDYPWEQEGLDYVKGLMPKAEPYRAWATFSFTARSGRVNECDLFIATLGGLYLVELKGHRGEVVNNGGWWTFHSPSMSFGTGAPTSPNAGGRRRTSRAGQELHNDVALAWRKSLTGAARSVRGAGRDGSERR